VRRNDVETTLELQTTVERKTHPPLVSTDLLAGISGKRINNFSGGLCSFWSAWRDVQEVGPENVVLLFADTLVESDDLYQFLKDASALLGVPVTRVSRELTPWQLFRQERMIGNNKYPICSVKLKREVLDGWMAAHYEMNRDQSNMLLPKATLSIGFDWTELHRTQNMRNEHPMWDIRAPMQQEPIWDKCKMEREAAKLGLKIGEAYVQGFPHNNCGKRCVRAGITHWVHLYHHDLAAYVSWEVEEWDCKMYLETLGIEPLSMLKDRRGGTTSNLYLRQLRAFVEKYPAGECVDHLPAWAKWLDENSGVEAVGLYGTSVSENIWHRQKRCPHCDNAIDETEPVPLTEGTEVYDWLDANKSNARTQPPPTGGVD
jgi:hypothetical protein